MRYVDTLNWFEKFFIMWLFLDGGIRCDMYAGTVGDWWVWRLCSVISYTVFGYYLYKILWDKQ